MGAWNIMGSFLVPPPPRCRPCVSVQKRHPCPSKKSPEAAIAPKATVLEWDPVGA